jgi:hypothetical protein
MTQMILLSKFWLQHISVLLPVSDYQTEAAYIGKDPACKTANSIAFNMADMLKHEQHQ